MTVDKAAYQFSHAANAGIIRLTSEGTGTWTATVPEGGSWLTCSASGTAGGYSDIPFQVAVNNTSTVRTGIIRFLLVHNGNRIVKEVVVTQYPTDLIEVSYTYPDGGSYYITDQLKQQAFIVKSATAWEVEVLSDTDGAFRTLYTTGGAANWETGGEKVYFALNTLTGGPYSITLQVKSVSGAYQPYQVVITAAT